MHFSQELLVWSWSNFDFCLCFGCQVSKFFSLFCIFSGTTGFWSNFDFSQELFCILVWSWSNFYFCLCCVTLQPIVKFHNFLTFCIFLKNYWSSSNFDFWSCCGNLQPVAKFQKFLSFWHFLRELLVWSWSNFDFCLCCGTLQPIVKFPNFLTFWHFLRNFWSYLDETLIFVYAVAFYSQL